MLPSVLSLQSATRASQILRTQASAVLSTTAYVQILGCILIGASAIGILLRNDLRSSLIAVCGVLMINIVVLELVCTVESSTPSD